MKKLISLGAVVIFAAICFSGCASLKSGNGVCSMHGKQDCSKCAVMKRECPKCGTLGCTKCRNVRAYF